VAESAHPAARVALLARIRAALAGSPPPQARAGGPDAAGHAPRDELRARFSQMLERVGGHVHRARDERDAAARLAAIVAEHGAREVALSDAPLVRRLAAQLPQEVRRFDGWVDRERLFACDLGLSAAQAGVAETGTLVLESAAERHRLVSLVPPVHVAVLPAEAILADLDAALAALGRAGPASRAVTLVTGPSRTADIELELVVGVHGPRELHVVVLEESLP
jgi:L-lactate dehydrogenase complex protein LldG